jgi:hypothetical protein
MVADVMRIRVGGMIVDYYPWFGPSKVHMQYLPRRFMSKEQRASKCQYIDERSVLCEAEPHEWRENGFITYVGGIKFVVTYKSSPWVWLKCARCDAVGNGRDITTWRLSHGGHWHSEIARRIRRFKVPQITSDKICIECARAEQARIDTLIEAIKNTKAMRRIEDEIRKRRAWDRYWNDGKSA